MIALFVSIARSGLNSVSCLSEKPVWTNGPKDCSPAAIANNTVMIAPHAAVTTPIRPLTAAAVRIRAGARPSGAATGIASAIIACSLLTLRTQTQTPISAKSTARTGTKRKISAVMRTHAIASATPSWPATATTATSPAAASDAVSPKLARSISAKTGKAANSAKKARRIGWP